MAQDVLVPSMGESVTTATIARWKKKVGDAVAADEALVELDSDKASVEVPSPVAGRVAELLVAEGAEVAIGQAIARVEAGAVADVAPLAVAAPAAERGAPTSPSVRKAAHEAGVDVARVAGSGPGGRVTRADVAAAAQKPVPVAPPAAPKVAPPVTVRGEEVEEIVPMTTLRKRIAARLVQAQSEAAILTTFNEVDMSAVMALRERYQDRFTKKYGIKLGFMSFFVKAAIDALKATPSANAEIRGTDIVYKHYYHVGVAVSGPRGLVVPVLRHADRLSFAETEQAIAAFGERARANQLSVDDLTGGTFTVSNGGIFGSMMSTPILNPPQVAILGMHAIQKRAVVVDDTIVIRPMMYLAVSYDHRLLDGREAVTFLVRIKECLENPERMLLEV
jgi:2-oxoglutarate dehydrogenase E2 component (dihydrolipoamide succinyltransferase)